LGEYIYPTRHVRPEAFPRCSQYRPLTCEMEQTGSSRVLRTHVDQVPKWRIGVIIESLPPEWTPGFHWRIASASPIANLQWHLPCTQDGFRDVAYRIATAVHWSDIGQRQPASLVAMVNQWQDESVGEREPVHQARRGCSAVVLLAARLAAESV